LKIIQLNIWGGKLGFQVIDFLKAEKPDFVCMQEVHDLKGSSGALFSTLDEIKEEGGFSESFMSPTYSFRYMERELEYGNAILGKTPFDSTETVFTRGAYKRNFDFMTDDHNARNLQVSATRIGNTPLHILNHHGHHVQGSKAGNDEITQQMRIIADAIEPLAGPVILCGDFNLAPSSPSLAVINEKLTNLSIAYKLKRTYSQFSIINEVCDYIFVNDRVKVRRFEMSKALVSDHKALILEFDL
jgi:endonuclease/exonuclease/phosphatase family metal-dependent hydrolase